MDRNPTPLPSLPPANLWVIMFNHQLLGWGGGGGGGAALWDPRGDARVNKDNPPGGATGPSLASCPWKLQTSSPSRAGAGTSRGGKAQDGWLRSWRESWGLSPAPPHRWVALLLGVIGKERAPPGSPHGSASCAGLGLTSEGHSPPPSSWRPFLTSAAPPLPLGALAAAGASHCWGDQAPEGPVLGACAPHTPPSRSVSPTVQMRRLRAEGRPGPRRSHSQGCRQAPGHTGRRASPSGCREPCAVKPLLRSTNKAGPS